MPHNLSSPSPRALPSTPHDNPIEPWGWNLPFTQHVLSSFDTLSQLLAPNNLVRIPGSHVKVPGEIRPRTKSLQQVVRSVMFFEGGEDSMREVQKRMESLEPALKGFLANVDVSALLGSQNLVQRWGWESVSGKEMEMEKGKGRGKRRREMILQKRMGSVELKRKKDALSTRRREGVLELMKGLEKRIEANLRGVEDVMWPRKIIKFDSPSSPAGTEIEDEVSPYRIVRAWIWTCELAEELWEDGGELLRGGLRVFWGFLRSMCVPMWTVILLVGLALAYLHMFHYGL